MGLYSLNGRHGNLFRDDAIFVYSGQQLAQGTPPYVSTFHAKTPLSPILCGLGVLLGRALGTDDLAAVRFVFLFISSLTAVAVYFLAVALFESRLTGVVAALVFVSFWGFGLHAFSGPRPKAPMVLFEALSLFLAARRKWFWSALCGSFAFLVWQPTAVYAAASVALAATQSESWAQCKRNVIRALSGAALPLLLILLFFAVLGGLLDFLADTVIFNLFYLERQHQTFPDRITAVLEAINTGYTMMRIPIFIGFVTLCAMYPWRLAHNGWSVRRLLRDDPFAALLVTLPAPVVWSLLDFQRYPDFFVFLPYVAVACAGLLDLTTRAISARGWLPPIARRSVLAAVCVTLVVASAFQYTAGRRVDLRVQREWAERIAQIAGPEGTIVSLGVPQVLVLLNRTNPNRHVFLCCGIWNWIGASTPGGFEAWIRQIAEDRPAVILLEHLRGPVGRHLARWLRGYQGIRVGDWAAHVRLAEGSEAPGATPAVRPPGGPVSD